MNRPIKFRAWDKIAKMWVQVSWACDIDNGGSLYTAATVPQTDVELMQFTGLLDKNGKEIYEGDVLSYDTHKKGAVEYMNNGFWVMDGERRWMPAQNYCEVIGNIYENPDLLSV